MRRHLSPVLLRLGGWPRRLAVVACLLLAAASALGAHAPADRPAAGNPLTVGLGADQVASSVTTSADVTSFVHPGDHVDLLAGPSATSPGDAPAAAASVIARDVRVLAVVAPRGAVADASSTQLIVSTTRSVALALAGVRDQHLVAVVGHSP